MLLKAKALLAALSETDLALRLPAGADTMVAAAG